MIGIDVSPLVLERRRGVARGLRLLLEGLARIERAVPVALMAPRPFEPDTLPTLDGVIVADPAARDARNFRRALPALVRRHGLTAFVAPWLAAPRLSVPVTVLVHELPFVRHGAIEGRLRALRQRVWLRRHAREGTTRFVVPSDATRRDLCALRPDLAERVTVIPHGFDPSPWRAARQAPATPPYAVVVGTGKGAAGARKKGIDLLPEIERRLGTRLGVRVLGDDDVPDAEVRTTVAAAHVLLYPSRSEGFGFPPLEAMAAGVPVVTTTAGSIPEVVGDAALCVAPGDAGALADAALEAAFDEDTRTRLIDAGATRADAFPRETAAQAWMDLWIGVEAMP
ncbi:MAG: glycosyltransferase [Planctomycetota bacterium]|nr:glycosyltransferase [Planctomycetota bacterium]